VIAQRLAPAHAVVVGDSWVDGVAAAAAGVPFVAYRPDPDELARRGVSPLAALTDLAALPSWLSSWEGASTAPSQTSPTISPTET
jgi:beta-phosphoglucomutase-like phosphatase (HAD superfamily)